LPESALGHKRTNPPRAKLPRCPLLSKSGQKSAKLVCPLSANRDRRTAANSAPIRSPRRRGQAAHAVGARLPSIDCNLGPDLFHYEKDDDDSDGANGNDVRGGAQERHTCASLICPGISVIL